MKPLFLSYELSVPQGERVPYDPAEAPALESDAVEYLINEHINGGDVLDMRLGRFYFRQFSLYNGGAAALRFYYHKKENFGGRPLPQFDPQDADRVAVARIGPTYGNLFLAANALLRRYERTQEETAAVAMQDHGDGAPGELARLLGIPAADILDLRPDAGGAA